MREQPEEDQRQRRSFKSEWGVACYLTIGLLLVCVLNGPGLPALGDRVKPEEKGGRAMLKLPKPSFKAGEMSVAQALGERRSVREFEGTDLDMQTLSRLLWAAQGITDRKQNFRAAPSAGATYPLETYVLTASGVFHYLPGEHALQRVSDTDRRRELSSAALGQRWVAEAAVDIVFTAVYERTVERYGQRGRMYVHMEVGHAAENVLLQAVSLGLGSVPVGAFHNDKVSEVLNLPDNQTPLYIIPVGKPDRT